jgi:hypothetical protein
MTSVGAADRIVFTGSLLKEKNNEAPNLYVEMRSDSESVVQRTRVVRNQAPSWNQEFIMYVH